MFATSAISPARADLGHAIGTPRRGEIPTPLVVNAILAVLDTSCVPRGDDPQNNPRNCDARAYRKRANPRAARLERRSRAANARATHRTRVRAILARGRDRVCAPGAVDARGLFNFKTRNPRAASKNKNMPTPFAGSGDWDRRDSKKDTSRGLAKRFVSCRAKKTREAPRRADFRISRGSRSVDIFSTALP